MRISDWSSDVCSSDLSLDKTAQVQTEFLAVEFEASYCRKLGTQRVGRLTGRLCLPHVRFRTWIQMIDVTHSTTATSSTRVADAVQEEDDTGVNALIRNARRMPKQLYNWLHIDGETEIAATRHFTLD